MMPTNDRQEIITRPESVTRPCRMLTPHRWLAVALLTLAAVVLPLAAPAATVTLVADRFSDDRPVPHFRYDGGVVQGDLAHLEAVYRQYTNCDPARLPEVGGNCAVFSLNSEGGNYIEGLQMAHFFRDNAIATWVEHEDYCFSACAFAFLGGSGYSSTESIGPYIDRTLEPGAVLGFHAP